MREVWKNSTHKILSYMDVDLSTSLEGYFKLIEAVSNGKDIAIASRHLESSYVKRSLKRGILSRGYNFLVNLFFNVNFKDAQCGCKAMKKEVLEEILHKVKDQEWFFDTELLVRSEKAGIEINEIAVDWIENDKSKVHIFKTVYNYIKSLIRLKTELFFNK